MISDQEIIASDVLATFGIKSPPVDVFAIAREEKIELCPTKSGTDFNGRIEYHPDIRRFFLFYPDIPDATSHVRIRFSVGHELGHYYLDKHRALLISGKSHNSTSGFICDKAMELEADSFAAGLLIPEKTLKQRLSTTREFLTLSDILRLAEDCKSSKESAAIRYVKYAAEICIVLVSREGKVVYSVGSDDAQRVGFFVKSGTLVPQSSAAAVASISKDMVSCEVPGATWCPWTKMKTLFEESIALDRSGTVLTLLVYSKP